jgi:hypothetical protein
MEDKSNAIQIHKIISFAPKYMAVLMRLLTTPAKFLTDEFAKEKSTKEAMAFLCASFVVATARILYGEFDSLSSMEANLRWDSVITLLFIVGALAIATYIMLHSFRSSLGHDQCLTCSIYFMGAVFIFMAMAYSVVMPLLPPIVQTVSQITDPMQLTSSMYYMLEAQLLFMIGMIFGSLVFWPLYLFWGIGKAGRLGALKNIGFITAMYVVCLMGAFIASISVSTKEAPVSGGRAVLQSQSVEKAIGGPALN